MDVEEDIQEIEEENSSVVTGIVARLLVGHREAGHKVKRPVLGAVY